VRPARSRPCAGRVRGGQPRPGQHARAHPRRSWPRPGPGLRGRPATARPGWSAGTTRTIRKGCIDRPAESGYRSPATTTASSSTTPSNTAPRPTGRSWPRGAPHPPALGCGIYPISSMCHGISHRGGRFPGGAELSRDYETAGQAACTDAVRARPCRLSPRRLRARTYGGQGQVFTWLLRLSGQISGPSDG